MEFTYVLCVRTFLRCNRNVCVSFRGIKQTGEYVLYACKYVHKNYLESEINGARPHALLMGNHYVIRGVMLTIIVYGGELYAMNYMWVYITTTTTL